jgi:DNA-binding CsgD family transcriptional regulator/hypothetical membrane protein
MPHVNTGRALAAIVAAVAVLNTLSAVSMPVRDRKADPLLVVAWLAFLLGHAALYLLGDRVRERRGLLAYVAAQAALLFVIALSRVPGPVTMALFMAATAEIVVLAEARWRWGTVRITLGAIVLFVGAALISSDLYRATTAGLLLAVTGLIAHAAAALVSRRPSPVAAFESTPAMERAAPARTGLSARETDVLRQLVTGARNSDIAAGLGITERTVKAHLGSIYQKLGVETRAAAVAAAVQRNLV